MCRRLGLVLALASLAWAAEVRADPNAKALAAADASVRSDVPDTVLQADLDLFSNAFHRTFVAFRLPDPSEGGIVAATLRMRMHPSQSSPQDLHEVAVVTSDAWNESTLTWNTQPEAAAEPIGVVDAAALLPGREAAIDVTAAAIAEQQSDRGISFRIAPAQGSTNALLRFRTREQARSFDLELVLDPAPRLATGDLVTVDPHLESAVVATDPALLMQKLLAPIIAPYWFYQFTRDPIDGSWIALDRFRDRILRVDATTGALAVVYASERVTPAGEIAVGPDGSIWAALYDYDPDLDTQTWSLSRVDRDTGEVTDVASGGLLTWPNALVIDATGTAAYWAQSTDTSVAIVRIDAATGAQSALVSGGLVQAPRALAFGLGTDLWVIDGANSVAPSLIRVDLGTGSQTQVASLPSYAGQIAYEPAGTLVVASGPDSVFGFHGGGWIARFDPVSGASTGRIEDWDAGIGGIVLDPDGTCTVAINDSTGVRVSRIDPETATETPLHGWVQGNPNYALLHDIAIDARRSLIVVSGTYPGTRVVRIDPRTGFQQLIANARRLSPTGGGPNRSLREIRLALDGRIFVAESLDTGAEIVEIDAGGARTVRFASPDPVSSFAVDRDGSLLVASAGATTAQLHRVDPTGASTPIDGPIPVRFPRLDFGADRTLFAASAGRVFRFDEATATWPEIASTSVAPSRVFLDGVGTAWFARSCNSGAPTTTTRLDLATGVAETLPLCGQTTVVRPRCANTLDDDRDGAVDWPEDSGCIAATDDSERAGACGLGAELLPLMLAFQTVLRRRRSATPPER